MRSASLPFCLGVLLVAPVHAATREATGREAQVRERGTAVMPFALDGTLHQFEKNAGGGVQRVTARAGHDAEVAAIRTHLRDIAERFARRDFSDPAKIHGEDMPGLAALRAAPREALRVEYRDLPDGAEVTYVATTPAIATALHEWFDAQVSDHGHDATDHLKHHAAD